MKQSSNQYQLVVMYPTSLADVDQKKNLKEIEKQLITKVKKIEFKDWGEKELQYTIKANNKARFWLGGFSVDNGVEINWSGLKTFLNRDKNIIRYLILKI